MKKEVRGGVSLVLASAMLVASPMAETVQNEPAVEETQFRHHSESGSSSRKRGGFVAYGDPLRQYRAECLY